MTFSSSLALIFLITSSAIALCSMDICTFIAEFCVLWPRISRILSSSIAIAVVLWTNGVF